MLEKRVYADDAVAILQLGGYHLNGHEVSGIKIDLEKAVKLFHRASELGCAEAYHQLGNAYEKGCGVSKDVAKARQHYEKGAIGGYVNSRFNLGCYDANHGNFDRAMKHYLIAASQGQVDAVKNIKEIMDMGYATQDHHAEAHRGYKQYLDEVRSDRRDSAAANY
jgi:TPR repeat protein